MKICIDLGHGLPDPGAVHGSHKEMIIVMAVGRSLQQELIRRGHTVELTRTTERALHPDKNKDLLARAKVANQFGATLCISLHCNSSPDRTANGIEVHCYPGSIKGKALAGEVQKSMVKTFGLRDRGVKEANFVVLRATNMPGVLVELGFLSNDKDRGVLTSPGYAQRAAVAIANGIETYLK